MASSVIHCLIQEKLQFQSSSFEVTDLLCLKMGELMMHLVCSCENYFFLKECILI